MQDRPKQDKEAPQTWTGWFWEKMGYGSEKNTEEVAARDAKLVVNKQTELQTEVKENKSKGLEMSTSVPASKNKPAATQSNETPQVVVEFAKPKKNVRTYTLNDPRAHQALFKAPANNKNAHSKPDHRIDQPRGRGPR